MNFAKMSNGAVYVGMLSIGMPVGRRIGAPLGGGVFLEPIEDESMYELDYGTVEQLRQARISPVTGVLVASPSPLELALEAEMLRYTAQCLGDPAPQAWPLQGIGGNEC